MATVPSVSYSITVRLEVPAGGKAVSQLTHAVEQAGGMVTALDVTTAGHEKLRIDVTCAARDTDHAQAIVDSAGAASTASSIHKVSDRTFLMHLGGKIEMQSKVPLRNRDELSMAYTPGVARVSLAIARNPEDARRLTIKRNSVAVVTDGSAVLGLGNIGPAAALPVMEGKAALFKRFAGIDAWPICLDTQDVDEIVRTVQIIAPGVRRHQPGGHLRAALLRGRAAAARPARHPGLPRRPARHRDRRAGRAHQRPARGRQGPAPTSASPWRARARRAPPCCSCCSPPAPRTSSSATTSARCTAAATTSTSRCAGSPTTPTPRATPATCAARCKGADVFIGVSAPGILTGDDIATMAEDAVVFALANPEPGGRPGDGPRARRGGRHRPQRLPQPDQQRAGVPGRLPRPARRPEPYGHPGHAARRRPGPGRAS